MAPHPPSVGKVSQGFTWHSPLQAIVEGFKKLIQKVIEIASSVLNWFLGNPDQSIGQEYVWRLVKEERKTREVRALPSPPVRAVDSPGGARAEGERRGLTIPAERSASPLNGLAALSVEEIARREGLAPHLAQLFSFCIKTTAYLSRIIFEEKVLPSERSIQRIVITACRSLEEFMKTFLPHFSPVTMLLEELRALRLEGSLSQSQQNLIERIRKAGSPEEELVRMFREQRPLPQEEEIEAYARTVALFFQMINDPRGESNRLFWGKEVDDALREQVLYDALMQFAATPVAAFLEEMNRHFGERLRPVLIRCFNENGLLIARALFNRLRYLLDHDALAFTKLFDDVIQLANQQAETIGAVEGKNKLLYDEAREWKAREREVECLPEATLLAKWRRALRYEIVVGIDQIAIRRQKGEQLIVYERAIVAFKESPIWDDLAREGSHEMQRRIDAKLEEIRSKFPKDPAELAQCKEKADTLQQPRYLIQLLVYNALCEEKMAALPQAQRGPLPDLIEAFIHQLTAQRVSEEHPLKKEDRDFEALAKRVIALLLPEQRVGGGEKMVDGLEAIFQQMTLPKELEELIEYAIKNLPKEIIGDSWNDRMQQYLEEFLRSPLARVLLEGALSRYIKAKVRPQMLCLVIDGLSGIFQQITSQEGLRDVMAFNILPEVNKLLMVQLAFMTLRTNIKEAVKLYQEGKQPEELTHALEVWVIERLRGVYAKEREGLLTWERDVNEETFQAAIHLALARFLQRLEDDGEALTSARFEELLTLHFVTPPAQGDDAPAVYGDLVENVLRLGQIGPSVERFVIPRIKEITQTAIVEGLREYRLHPSALIHEAMRGLSSSLNEEALELLFQQSPEHIEEELAALRQEQERAPDAAREERMRKLENLQGRFRERAEAHAPERIQALFAAEVDKTAKLAYELIHSLATAHTPWYLGGAFVGGIAAGATIGEDSAHLNQVIRTCFERLTRLPSVTEELMFRVFHAALDALHALPVYRS